MSPRSTLWIRQLQRSTRSRPPVLHHPRRLLSAWPKTVALATRSLNSCKASSRAWESQQSRSHQATTSGHLPLRFQRTNMRRVWPKMTSASARDINAILAIRSNRQYSSKSIWIGLIKIPWSLPAPLWIYRTNSSPVISASATRGRGSGTMSSSRSRSNRGDALPNQCYNSKSCWKNNKNRSRRSNLPHWIQSREHQALRPTWSRGSDYLKERTKRWYLGTENPR